jgi:aerotaxis receptor
MRINEPVTGREYHIHPDATLMSTTDVHSKITYANAAFIEASGYTDKELQGQPHNIVRHPDMPAEAFEDMWRTLKGGEPWTALVKNRRKNGDHYWVRANATPVIRNGQTVGYLSVRTTPERHEVDAAELLYLRFREGRAGHLCFHKGLVVRKGSMAWRSMWKTLPLRWRIRVMLGSAWLALIAGTALAGGGNPALLISAGVSAVVLAGLALWMQQQIAQPAEALLKDALKVASGESQNVAHMNRSDELGMTLRTISQLGLMFRWLINDVSGQVGNVQVASSEIAMGNNDLSVRTEKAASSVQQTASAMTQMTSTVQANADTATQANQLSESASEAARANSQVMAEVVSTMGDISTSSHRIADIIGVIDGIAFQTNILALNAAVEAARAGEQGRGFAVVAGEVRSLARRSADAAKEIKSLIQASVDKVEAGTRLVDGAGQSMGDLQAKVARVTDLIAEISAATREQTSGIGQVGESVSELDQITQQNAALVEQSAAAAESLKAQANRLAEAVQVFR